MDTTLILILLMTIPAVISAAMTPLYVKANKDRKARREATLGATAGPAHAA